ncbi:MAG: alpha-amylase family glycosyl hydrolase [Actinomycetota bacterium]|nr:alpha-amylase family glycosyl hydrolase [Actinomycetota bacterium]
MSGAWWRDGVIYQIYPRSFADSNGDGVGDLAGIVNHLGYLAWLGVDAIWVNPITLSPDMDWGYDVADYRAVQPVLGTLEDVDTLVAEAGRREIRVLLDLVPNHTSDMHPWFISARQSRDSPHRDFYVWADGKPDGSPPNNWRSSFGGPAWTFDPETDQWYLHHFLPSQPDLNWWNEEVRSAFDDILRFWFDRGVAGFRVDVCQKIVKDALLRDNPPSEPDDHPYVRAHGQRQVYNSQRPETHDVFRRWRAIAEDYDPPRLLLGETYVMDVARLAAYYGGGPDGDQLHLACNFVFLHEPFTAPALSGVVDTAEAHLQAPAWPVWAVSTHDLPRYPTRWLGGDGRGGAARCTMLMLLTLRGTPTLYYGDELGLPDVPVGPGERSDPVGTGVFQAGPGRDPCRTPMPWTPAPGAGFTAPGVRLWLPLGDREGLTVAEQQSDPASMLHLCRDLLAVRRARADLRTGTYTRLSTPEGLWAWRRGSSLAVALNLTADPGGVDLGSTGRVLIGTDRSRDGEAVDGRLGISAFEGVLVELEAGDPAGGLSTAV